MSGMRTIFMVLAPAGESPTAMSHNMPANQRLREVLEVMLALPAAFQRENTWGSVEDYTLLDLYGQGLDPNILVRQAPFPGCVIAIFKSGRVSVGGQTLTGSEAAAAVANSISMGLMAQREDEEDPVARRYARFIKGGAWRYEPTPITGTDVGLSYHELDGEAGAHLLELLSARGLRCRARRIPKTKVESVEPTGHSPAEDVRALVVMIGPKSQNDPWIAFDIGWAWAAGIPVIPVLIGEWNGEPPNILAPYQRLNWEKQQEKVVNELVELLDLTPWSLATLKADVEHDGSQPTSSDKSQTEKPRAKAGRRPAKRKKAH